MTTPELTIELLGRLRLRRDGNLLCEFAPQQSGMLLAYLALYPDRAFTREELIAWLLPDLEIEAGRHKLRQYLYALRRELAACSVPEQDLLLISRNQIGLNSAKVRTDVVEFVARVQTSASADVRERILLLTSADALYRGELLPGFYEDAFETERRRLADMRYNALLSLANCHRETGDQAQALEVLQRLISIEPLHEEAYCAAMRLYAETGRFAAAQRTYQRMAEALKQQLDIEPSPEAQRLLQTLRFQAQEADTPAPPVTRTPTAAPDPMPVASEPPVAVPYGGPVAPPPIMAPARRAARKPLLAVTLIIALVTLGRGLLMRRHTDAHFLSLYGAKSVPKGANGSGGASTGTVGKESWVSPMLEQAGDSGSEPTAMTVDELGSIYITGFVHTQKRDVDYVTLKYDGAGHQLWQQRYDNPVTHDCDRARSLAVDVAHNVYVTGDSYNGDWDKGGTDYDVVTIKYDADGNRSATWPDIGFGKGVRRFDGAHRADWGRKIALDGAGNVYVGVTSGRLTARGGLCSDFVILKYDVKGNLIWSRRYNSTGDGVDELIDMAVDTGGNITVTGVGRGFGHSAIVTARYDSAGNRRWTQVCDGPGNGEATGLHLTLDPLGNVYVAGYADLGPAQLGGAQMHILTLKYGPNGALKWCQLDPDGWDVSKPGAIAVDPAGNVAVAGTACRGTCAIRILVYDAYGLTRWSKLIAGGAPNDAGDPYNMAHGVTFNREGDLLVTGSLHNSPRTGDDYTTFRFSALGIEYGFLTYDDPWHGVDIGTAMAMDGANSLYVVGQAGGASHRSITLLKYAP
jgi:DNA-binding SARP family transcriptional activator